VGGKWRRKGYRSTGWSSQPFGVGRRKVLNGLGWVPVGWLWAEVLWPARSWSYLEGCGHSSGALRHASSSLSLSPQHGRGRDRAHPFPITSLPSLLHSRLQLLCGSPSRQEQQVLVPPGQGWCFLKAHPGAARTRAGIR